MIEEIEMIEVVYPECSEEEYMNYDLQPVFFGSALNNFGVKELLDVFIDIAPQPQAKEADIRIVEPFEEQFTGFVFKIHANMDPKHRDRLAFVKIVSGKFERNKNYLHVRSDKKIDRKSVV